MAVFEKYSEYYDLLYRDKDYRGEAAYVARWIRELAPRAASILEFGSGTGRHGRILAEMGFDVHGIERSEEMVAIAQATGSMVPPAAGGRFTCETGDICAVNLGRCFDAVIALFHVMSYQTTDEALAATFQSASRHLSAGGVFLFDVWHGPAVLHQGLSHRVKEVAQDGRRVTRTARPEVDAASRRVKVIFDIDCEDRNSGHAIEFSEEHNMRYIFPAEIDRLAGECGFAIVKSEEFLTARPVSPDTWGVSYVLQLT